MREEADLVVHVEQDIQRVPLVQTDDAVVGDRVRAHRGHRVVSGKLKERNKLQQNIDSIISSIIVNCTYEETGVYAHIYSTYTFRLNNVQYF